MGFPPQGLIPTVITATVIIASGILGLNNYWTGVQHFSTTPALDTGQLNYSNHLISFQLFTYTVPGLNTTNKWTGTNNFTQNPIVFTGTFNYLGHLFSLPTTTGTAVTQNGTFTHTININQTPQLNYSGHQITITANTQTLGGLNNTQTWNGNNTMKFGAGGIIIRNPASTFTVKLEGGAQASNQTLAIPPVREGETLAIEPQTNQTTNSTAQTTTSTTFVMTGNWIYVTPEVTGRIMASLSSTVADGTLGDGCSAELQYGTGNAPRGGQAVTGSTLGTSLNSNVAAAGEVVPLTIYYQQTGLVVGTRYWVEPAFEALTGGTCTFNVKMITGQEY